MYIDRALAASQRARTAADHGVNVLLDAWSAVPVGARAAMIAAQGDLTRAAAQGGGGWIALVKGDVAAALNSAREAIESPGMRFLEAEALFCAGAVVSGLQRLEALHARGDSAGTLALARRRHQLGDHAGAAQAALRLPGHVQAALTGARAALAGDRDDVALRFVEPFLHGVAPVPEPGSAGAVAMTAASILARTGEHERLRSFVDRLLNAGDLPEDMMPPVGRAAWIGGRAGEAWSRFGMTKSPWCVAARLELAILAGNLPLAERLAERAGPLGAPSVPAVHLLGGGAWMRDEVEPSNAPFLSEDAREMFREGRTVHVWRTHPYRWQPWIESALRTPAEVTVCDLAAGRLPDPDVLPSVVLDDGALIDMLAPVPVPVAATRGTGVAIGRKLCHGIGIGHDWPDQETEVVRRALPPAPAPEEAAVWVLGAGDALECARTGRALVVIAPPGDPFWTGPVPERVWPSMHVVRADAKDGWNDAGARVISAAEAVLHRAAGG